MLAKDMDMNDEKEPRIKIDPLPEKKQNSTLTKQEQKRVETEGKKSVLPKKEPSTYASGKRIGRPPKEENKKKTNDTYTITPARKRALEKARVMKSLKAEEKKKQKIKEDPVDFKQDIINSDLGEENSGIKDSYGTIEKPEKYKPLKHENSNEQLGFGMNGKPSVFDVYNNKIAELEQQIKTLQKKGYLASTDIEYPERKGIDQMSGVNNTFKQNTKSSIFVKKDDIGIHKGKQQSSGIHNRNPFATRKQVL